MSNEKQLTEIDTRILQRLTFEINGYEVLIRSFLCSDQEFTLDEEKWKDLHARRNKLIHLREEILLRLLDKDFTGNYEIDFSAGKIKWG